jgi:hypothetical protein
VRRGLPGERRWGPGLTAGREDGFEGSSDGFLIFVSACVNFVSS